MKFAKGEDPLYDKLRSDGRKLFLVILIIKPYLTMENILVQMTYHHKAMIGLFFSPKKPYVPTHCLDLDLNDQKTRCYF